jgi:hypothetical protein
MAIDVRGPGSCGVADETSELGLESVLDKSGAAEDWSMTRSTLGGDRGGASSSVRWKVLLCGVGGWSVEIESVVPEGLDGVWSGDKRASSVFVRLSVTSTGDNVVAFGGWSSGSVASVNEMPGAASRDSKPGGGTRSSLDEDA